MSKTIIIHCGSLTTDLHVPLFNSGTLSDQDVIKTLVSMIKNHFDKTDADFHIASNQDMVKTIIHSYVRVFQPELKLAFMYWESPTQSHFVPTLTDKKNRPIDPTAPYSDKVHQQFSVYEECLNLSLWGKTNRNEIKKLFEGQ